MYLLEEKLLLSCFCIVDGLDIDELGSSIRYEVSLLYISLFRVRCADRVNK